MPNCARRCRASYFGSVTVALDVRVTPDIVSADERASDAHLEL
jgi:hypothetical protein